MNPFKLFRRPALACALLLLCGATLAQMPPGGGERRGRGPGMGEMPRREAGPRPGPPAVQVTDPLSAFERELPSLRMDLKLTAEQVANWDGFARSVRDAAEAARGVTRLTASLRVGEDLPSLGKSLEALAVLAAQRAAALTDANRAYAVLDGQFAPEQKSMLSRRFRQAVMEPLGA